MNAVVAKRGRPPKFKENFPELAMHLCRLGGTNKDLAAALGVSVAAIDKWMATKPEFAEAVKEGRELADARVASALYQRAIGASVPDSHVAVINDKVVVTPMVKHYPPDAKAAYIWLRNRRPDLWRERTSQDVTLLHAPLDPTPERSMDECIAFAKMIADADKELGPVVEAEIIPSTPALPPRSAQERVLPPAPVVAPEPEAAPTAETAPESTDSGDDFRALLGLPPREV